MIDRHVPELRMVALGHHGDDAHRLLVVESEIRRPRLTLRAHVALRENDERHRLIVGNEGHLIGSYFDRKGPSPVRLIDLDQLEHGLVLSEFDR